MGDIGEPLRGDEERHLGLVLSGGLIDQEVALVVGGQLDGEASLRPGAERDAQHHGVPLRDDDLRTVVLGHSGAGGGGADRGSVTDGDGGGGAGKEEGEHGDLRGGERKNVVEAQGSCQANRTQIKKLRPHRQTRLNYKVPKQQNLMMYA